MALARTRSVALLGMTGAMVDIEADLSSGLPGFTIIGLPDASLREAYNRVRSASANSGCPLPGNRITINLSPASLPKHGPAFDLAIAVACLGLEGVVSPEAMAGIVYLGELGLDGRLRPVRGVLPAALAARDAGFTRIMVAAANADEASLVPGLDVIPVASLRDAAIWHGAALEPVPVEVIEPPRTVEETPDHGLDLADVIGNREAIDALQVAAAGGHHLLMIGPPGAGKSMLADRLRGLLPDLDPGQALQVTCLRSVAGAGVGTALEVRPPLEAPHHTATAAAMVGGGSGQIRPGAAARASGGILFLDEAPEFAASVLDTLRQPLESGVITIHRSNFVASFPGRFQLVLAANPCPCGQWGTADGNCACSPMQRRRYLGRISGPLLDRIDIRLRIERVTATELRLHEEQPRLSSHQARERVREARDRAAERLAATPWRLNNELPGSWLRGQAALPRQSTAAIDRALERGAITMRGYDRVLRVAWTNADLAGRAQPSPEDVGRALFLRRGIP